MADLNMTVRVTPAMIVRALYAQAATHARAGEMEEESACLDVAWDVLRKSLADEVD